MDFATIHRIAGFEDLRLEASNRFEASSWPAAARRSFCGLCGPTSNAMPLQTRPLWASRTAGFFWFCVLLIVHCAFSVLFVGCFSVFLIRYSPPDRKGLLDFMMESAFAMLLHRAPTQYPARAARQWIPPGILPEQLASGSRRVSRQSCSPVDPAQYPARAAHQWIPPSIPPERLASGCRQVSRQLASASLPVSRPVSHQSCSPVDPAKYPAQVSHQSSPPVDPAEYPADAEHPRVDPAEYFARVARQWIPPSIPLEQPASGSCRVSC